MRASEILNEIAATDLYPQAFQDFRQKYLPFAGRKDLYVNFNDHVGNTLDKSFSPNPTHNDPTGLYAYPLEYVLNHPADIVYGQQARYLRVIRDTSHHKLVLSHITEPQAIELLTKMGVPDPKTMMGRQQAYMTKKKFLITGNKWAKLFFWTLQAVANENKSMPFGKVQSAMFLKAGVDALEDVAQSREEATVYHGEPEQVIFLTRSAFQVVEVFELRNEKSLAIHATNRTENLRRLPALVAKAIGDDLVSDNSTGERAGEQSFYTAAKRKIVIRLDNSKSVYDKKHRENTDHSPEKVIVTILGPDFKPVSGSYEPTVSYADIASDMAKKFGARQEGEGYEYTRESEYGPEIQNVISGLAQMAQKLKVDFTVPENQNTRYLIFKCVTSIGKSFSPFNKYSRQQHLEVARKVMQTFWGLQKKKPVQAEQIENIYKAAFEKGKWVGAFESMLKDMGIQSDYKTGDSYVKDYENVTIGRRGDDLFMKFGGKEHRIAEINNSKITDWTRPKEGYDETVALAHAKELADYLNKHHFYTDGWMSHDRLPEYFGIVYQDGQFKTLEEGSKKVGTLSKNIELLRMPLPDDQGEMLVAKMKHDIVHDWGPDNKPVSNHNTILPLLKLNDENQITWMSHHLERYIEWRKHNERDPESWQAKGGPRFETDHTEKTAWETLIDDSKFDPMAYIKKQGWTVDPKTDNTELLKTFDLKKNLDNGKVGADWKDIADPVGKFEGVEVYRVRNTDRWAGSRRYYVVFDPKPTTLFMTELDATEGTKDMAITDISDKLTPEDKKIARAVLRHLGLNISRSWAPLLK